MIERITGILLEKWTNSICIDANGVGYEVEVPTNIFATLPETGKRITLFTHLLIREDAHILFGFNNQQDRQLFKLLMKINGVGARTALSILSNITLKELASAVALQESSILTKVPGIGQKTAERLILEMKDKIKPSEIHDNSIHESRKKIDFIEALNSLGYSSKEIISIVNIVPEDLSLSESIKYALKIINNR